MGSGGTALGIIGIILAAGAIGFAFFVWNGQNTINSELDDLRDELNNLTGNIAVGIWDNLDENLNYVPHNSQGNWLFEFGDNNLSNTDYISVSNSNTRITLLKSGWYRIHLSVLLEGMSPATWYYIILYKNGVIESYLDFYEFFFINIIWKYISIPINYFNCIRSYIM